MYVCKNHHLILFFFFHQRNQGELKALDKLRELDLSNNRLKGSIPDAIGEMSNLEYLVLSANTLTGSLPRTLDEMTSIVELDLSKNKIEGILPTGLQGLVQLKALYVSPPFLALKNSSNFSTLLMLWSHFQINDNLMTGPLPNDWSLYSIETLDFTNNEFLGHLPHSQFQLTTLVTFKLSNNFLTGTIPPELQSSYHLEVFDM